MKTLFNDRYELGEEVGKGGMALTYRAHDVLLDRTVAVKVMREQFGADPDFVERFRREAQAAASLSHPNIAGVYDTGSDDGRHFIVMEFVEGENLEQRLRRDGPLDPLAAIDIALQVAAALEAAHRRGIVHRDVKPHNILINREGRVKVTDFGIAKAVSASRHTDTGTIMGSVHYFSPEQARGDIVGPQSDLYALGIVLFEAVTGRRPFEGDHPVAVAHKQLYDPAPSPSEHRPDLPEELEALILRCLEKSLARRFASAGELISALESAAERIAARRPGRRPRSRTARRGVGRRVALVLGVMLAVGAAGYYLVSRGEQPVLVSVPDVTGLDPTSAQRLLADAGLGYRLVPERVESALAEGLAVRQNPRARARVARDTQVSVWLSGGTGQTTVPDVGHMSQTRAEQLLRQADLEPGQIIEQYDERVPAGYVVSSEPAGGQKIEKGSPVALIISRGAPPATWEPPEVGPDLGAEATIAYTVPQDVGESHVRVRIEVSDDRGKRVLYDALHLAGDQLPPLRVRYRGEAMAWVLVDGRERWSQALGSAPPGDPPPAPKPPPPKEESPPPPLTDPAPG